MDGRELVKFLDVELKRRGIPKGEFESLHLRQTANPEKSTQTVEISGLSHVLNCSYLFKSGNKSVVKVLSKMVSFYNE